MADRWFRVPTATIDGRDGPKYRGHDGVTGFSGNTIGITPRWVVRLYGDTAALDGIASQLDTVELTVSEAAQLFDGATSQPHLPDTLWNASTVNEGFNVE
jgi:hypothetical protein